MTDLEETVEENRLALLDLSARVKRLEGVEGADRRLVPPERSDKGPDDGEQRSVEGCAVPPGEAEAALASHVGLLHHEAAMLIAQGNRNRKAGWTVAARDDFEAAARVARRADVLATLLPKPDSDAPHPEPAESP